MRILVFGGTVFLGRAVVEAALERGHDVTTFTRGVSGEPRPGVTALHGDRTQPADLAVALAGRSFDAVVDTSARDPDRPVAIVDVRDLAGWLVTAAELGWSGPVNATGEFGHVTMGGLLSACRAATGSGAELVWAPDGVLTDHGVEPWLELPLWMPSDAMPGLWDVGTARARDLGLPSRPVVETIADTCSRLRPLSTIPVKEGYPTPGLPAGKERAVLAALNNLH